MKFTQNFDHPDERMRPFVIRTTAKSVRKRNIMLKIGIIVLLIIILLLGAFMPCLSS